MSYRERETERQRQRERERKGVVITPMRGFEGGQYT